MADEMLSMLAEHQGVPKDIGNEAQDAQSAQELEDVKLVNKLFQKAKKFRKKYDANWVDDYSFYRGKQWKEQRPSYRHSAVFNMVFGHIQGQVPILTDAFPTFEYLPEGPEDFELSEIMSQLAESDFKRENWLYQIAEGLFDANFYGTGMFECGYDYGARDSLGSICIKSVDPLYCFPDPKSVDVNKAGKFFIYAEPTELESLRAEYPDKASKIASDLIDPMNQRQGSNEKIKYQSPSQSMTVADGDAFFENGVADQVLKITLYIKSDEIIEIDGPAGDSGVPTEKIKKLKYPRGCKMVVAGGVLLEKNENPYEDGLFPFARVINYIDPREFWGISEIEQLKETQKLKNKILSFALDVLTLMGNPIWIVDESAGIDTDNLTNQPGLVVEKNKGGEVRREEGVQLQPWVLQLLDRISNEFDDIAGDSDVSKGVTPGAGAPGYAIDLLQQAQQTRLRQKARNLDACMQNLGQMYASRVFQFYTIPRVFRITQKDSATKFFKFHVEEREIPAEKVGELPTKQKYAIVRPWADNPDTGGGAFELETRELPIKGMLDLKVSTGTALPFAKTEKKNMALQLFDRGIIDEEEVLDQLDYPNKEKVLLRLKQRQAEEAQVAAQAAAAKASGGGGTGKPAVPPAPSAA